MATGIFTIEYPAEDSRTYVWRWAKDSGDVYLRVENSY